MLQLSMGISVYHVLCVWALHLHNAHLQGLLPNSIRDNEFVLITQTNLYKSY